MPMTTTAQMVTFLEKLITIAYLYYKNVQYILLI